MAETELKEAFDRFFRRAEETERLRAEYERVHAERQRLVALERRLLGGAPAGGGE